MNSSPSVGVVLTFSPNDLLLYPLQDRSSLPSLPDLLQAVPTCPRFWTGRHPTECHRVSQSQNCLTEQIRLERPPSRHRLKLCPWVNRNRVKVEHLALRRPSVDSLLVVRTRTTLSRVDVKRRAKRVKRSFDNYELFARMVIQIKSTRVSPRSVKGRWHTI